MAGRKLAGGDPVLLPALACSPMLPGTSFWVPLAGF
jgi:hypothetical protein